MAKKSRQPGTRKRAAPRQGKKAEAKASRRKGVARRRTDATAETASRIAVAAGALVAAHDAGAQVEAAALDRADRAVPFHVIGMGASAGGLEAVGTILAGLQHDAGMAIVIVQHMAPKQESLLPGLLGHRSALPVIRAEDGMPLQADRVHVIPPGMILALDDGKLRLSAVPGDGRPHMPIDHFFTSLAAYAGPQAIGVVLSGNASDGALGLREVKEAGGITIAQDPQTAKYDSMPRAAIGLGAVDLVLPLPQIAEELIRIVQDPLVRRARPAAAAAAAAEQEWAAPGHDAATGVDENLTRIFTMLRSASGVDFTHYKMPTIRRRMHRRMVLHKIQRLDQYVRFLQQKPGEVVSLYQDILIHVTRFFREPESFEALAHEVLPAIAAQRRADQPIRVWVPGCSTGEEAYSVAITLLEFLGDQSHAVPVQLFATDVSESAVERARAGLYPESIAADVSAERLRRFFTRVDGHYRIAKNVRDACVFARQDITRDPPFSKMDLILCRNVLIYLGPLLQRRVMNVFHYALKPTGFLMLGAAESIGTHTQLFEIVDKRQKIYARKAAAVRSDVDFTHARLGPRVSADAAKLPPVEARGPTLIQNEANRVLLSRYAPPGVIVDDELQIVQFRGQTGKYLEPAPGEASLSLLKMAREGLLYGLRAAIQEARRSNDPVRKDRLRVKTNGGSTEVTVEVVPLTTAVEGRHFLVLFHEHPRGDGHAAPPPAPRRGKAAASKARRASRKEATAEDELQVARLQQELVANREYLQSIIQDLEAANEELQSANEEILSSNEELQSTNEELDTAKEELQSTNEELNTVNEELQAKNDELSHVNSDLVNLLASVQIAIVMVSNDLRIRRFTPMAEKVLNLIATDIGRPIGDIKPNIDYPDLEKLIAEAVDTMTIQEREVQDRNGNRLQLRIRPYKNVENRIDGAVLALFEMDGTDGPNGDARGNGQ
jgi:two-component system CheB/CheR fusion protein